MSRIGGYKAGRVPDDAIRKVAKVHKNLPQKVDLRKFLTPVEEQVGNSCVANAFAGAYEYLAKREHGESADVSRLFIYYNARYIADAHTEDAGSQMAHAIDALKEYGACWEEYWANDEGLILEEPHEDAYNQAYNFKIVEAEYIETDLDLWKSTLAEGFPIAFAVNTFQSFDHASHNRGRVSMPKTSDKVRETHGWHAMLCVGYSEPDRMFIVRNSWGEEWGDKGYCYMPYDYVIHNEYNGHDSWIIKSVESLEFDTETWDDDDDSYFEEDGTCYIENFYIEVEDVEEFATALEELCLEYVADEEDFYFDYEETEEDGCLFFESASIEIITEHFEDFLTALDELCEEFAIEENYSYEIPE